MTSTVLILYFVAAAQLMAASSSSAAYGQTTSFPDPPPPTTITEANCSPVDTGGAHITIKIENLYLDDGYEYTLESSIEGGLIHQNDLFYQEGDPIEYTGSENPLEHPVAFYTKQLTFDLSPSDIVNLGEEYVFKLYQVNAGGGQVFHSVTITCGDTTQPATTIDDLISDIEELGGVSQSVKTSLTAPLKQASTILTDDNPNNDKSACGKLDAFINQVNAAERRGSLTAVQASELRTQAGNIRTELGC
jgi:hypothetical protein